MEHPPESGPTTIEPDYGPGTDATPQAAAEAPAAAAAPAGDPSIPAVHADDVVLAPMVGPPGEQRGALVALLQNGDVRLAFVFAHTPQTLVRDRERGARGITEMFTIAFEIDASQALGAGDPTALAHGIHPQLSVLDQLFRENWILLLYGTARMIPLTPVSMSVTETAFDGALNPIRADVTFRAERITLTTDLNLGRYVNAAAVVTSSLMRLYKPAGVPPTIK